VAEWIDVSPSAELADRKPVRVSLGNSVVLLLKADEQLIAIGNQCTHQGAALDRGVVKIAGSVRTVTCPAHGSMFNLETGKPMRPPATKPIPVYDVKVEDGRVWLRFREQD
jgi:nitrite reductase/ring-hydroxylating ferredoxin subunit